MLTENVEHNAVLMLMMTVVGVVEEDYLKLKIITLCVKKNVVFLIMMMMVGII